jgi:hypothetical protein
MAERAVSCAWAVLDGGPRTAGCDWATRELARRRSGSVDVRLLWHPEGNWVELSLRDRAEGTGFRTVIAPRRALEAFYHPYAYGPASDSARAPEADDG